MMYGCIFGVQLKPVLGVVGSTAPLNEDEQIKKIVCYFPFLDVFLTSRGSFFRTYFIFASNKALWLSPLKLGSAVKEVIVFLLLLSKIKLSIISRESQRILLR